MGIVRPAALREKGRESRQREVLIVMIKAAEQQNVGIRCADDLSEVQQRRRLCRADLAE